MKLLLDTHFLYWLATEPHKVHPAERQVLADPLNDLYVSVVSLWEIRIKWLASQRVGSSWCSMSPEEAASFAVDQDMRIEILGADDTMALLDPPPTHRDPFDEMLLVHAQRLGARLLTRDRLLADHPLALQL